MDQQYKDDIFVDNRVNFFAEKNRHMTWTVFRNTGYGACRCCGDEIKTAIAVSIQIEDLQDRGYVQNVWEKFEICPNCLRTIADMAENESGKKW